MKTDELLIQADKTEDLGEWEMACWLRLKVVSVGQNSTFQSGDIGIYAYFIETPYIHVGKGRPANSPYGAHTEWWTWEHNRGWSSWHRNYRTDERTCPVWVRESLQECARGVVARLLASRKPSQNRPQGNRQ